MSASGKLTPVFVMDHLNFNLLVWMELSDALFPVAVEHLPKTNMTS